jgi:hypothetical protein
MLDRFARPQPTLRRPSKTPVHALTQQSGRTGKTHRGGWRHGPVTGLSPDLFIAANVQGVVLRSSGRGAGPPATEAHREGLVEDLQEHFGPKVHTASVVEIIEVAQMDMAVAEAKLHHPFAPPLIPRDTGKAAPFSLGHGCASMLR